MNNKDSNSLATPILLGGLLALGVILLYENAKPLKPHVVYRVKKGGKTIYIGYTTRFDQRYIEHTRKFGAIYMEEIDSFYTESAARESEKYELDKYARQHNGYLPKKNKQRG